MQKLWKNSLGLWYSNSTLRLGRTNKRRNGMESVEFAILDWIQQHLRCGFLDTVLPAVSWICNHGEVWIILAAVLLLRKRDRWVGVSVALALVLDLVCCNLILKPLVDRVRPFAVNTAVDCSC